MTKYILSVIIVFVTSSSVVAGTIGTPQQTWSTYLEAMKTGNKELAINTLTMDALTRHKPYIESLSPAEMFGLVDGAEAIISSEDESIADGLKFYEKCEIIYDQKHCSPIMFNCNSGVCKISVL